MVDIVDANTRSRMMAGIKGKDTKPEIFIRKALFRKGYRYRIHNKALPGSPDIVMAKYGVAIQIHGCYWHGHENCHLFRLPKSRTEFWEKKISGNKARDTEKKLRLLDKGWRVLTIWECAIKGKGRIDPDELIPLIENFLVADNRTDLSIRGNHRDKRDSTTL